MKILKLILLVSLYFSSVVSNNYNIDETEEDLRYEEIDEFDSNLSSKIVINDNNSTNIDTKVIYISYQEIPKRVINSQVFYIRLKNVVTAENIVDILYSFSNYNSIEILNDGIPIKRDIVSNYYYDTIVLRATGENVRIPDIEAIAVDVDDKMYPPSKLIGKKIESITLNSPSNYCNIVAKDLNLLKYKTTKYDDKSNIVVLSIEAKDTLLKYFNLKNVIKQGIESINEDIQNQKLIFYAIIDKSIEKFSFSYFNTQKNDFVDIVVPIIVDDDKVTTQTDLNPHSNSLNKFKVLVSVSIMVIGIVLVLIRKKLIYSLFIFIPAVYILSIFLLPKEKICIKPGSYITILPLYNSTIFKQTKNMVYFEKIGKTKGWTKVKISEDKIGWVRDDDICKN